MPDVYETNYNQRQFQLMLDIIREFDIKNIDYNAYGKMVDNLQALIDCLEGMPNNKKDQFWSAWGILEEVYADHENSGVHDFDERERKLINTALVAFEKLASQGAVE
jgi:hypothetical protein